MKGELKLKDAECRLEGSGGLMYDLLAKMVGNPAKIPKVPSSKTPPVWEGHGFFYIKPAMLRVKKPGKTYFFVCNMKDRDLWIDAVRSTIVSMENLRLSSAMTPAPSGGGVQLQQIPPLRSSPSSPSLTGVTVSQPSQFAPPGAESSPLTPQPTAPVRTSAEMSPVVVDAYMQARAQFGPASSSSHTAFATLRSGRSVHEEDGEDTTDLMVSTFSGAASLTPSQQDAETDIQKAQLNSFFQSPTRQVTRNPEKVLIVSMMDQGQLDAFVVSLGFPSLPPFLQGIPGPALIDVGIEDLVERGANLEDGKRFRSALRDYLSV
jgi:hypothetical protein